MAKTLSFAVLHFGVAFSIGWLFTGSWLVGGAIALIEEGDSITVDAHRLLLHLNVDDATLAARRAGWKPRTNDYQSGALYRYSRTVGPASLGAVTHPGGKAERFTYADI